MASASVRTSAGLACAVCAFVLLAAALTCVGVQAKIFIDYGTNGARTYNWWLVIVFSSLGAISAAWVLAFQACRGRAGWASPQAKTGIVVCIVGLLYTVALLAIVGPTNSSFDYFKYWSPSCKTQFIFSCCIAVALWVAALVLAVVDMQELRGCQDALGMGPAGMMPGAMTAVHTETGPHASAASCNENGCAPLAMV